MFYFAPGIILGDFKHTKSICRDRQIEVLSTLAKKKFDRLTEWLIEQYFLKSPHVFVSDKEYFLELIGRWKYDPCEEQVETDE